MRAALKCANFIKKKGYDEFKIARKCSLSASFYSLSIFILPLFCIIMCGLILKCEVLAGYLTGIILSTASIIILSSNCSYITNSALRLLNILQKDDGCDEIKTANNMFKILDETVSPYLSDFAQISIVAAFSLITLFIG